MAEEIEHFQEFTGEMYAKLHANLHKKGGPFSSMNARQLFDFLKIEIMELQAALDHLGSEAACSELVDIANFSLLMHKRLRKRTIQGK